MVRAWAMAWLLVVGDLLYGQSNRDASVYFAEALPEKVREVIDERVRWFDRLQYMSVSRSKTGADYGFRTLVVKPEGDTALLTGDFWPRGASTGLPVAGICDAKMTSDTLKNAFRQMVDQALFGHKGHFYVPLKFTDCRTTAITSVVNGTIEPTKGVGLEAHEGVSYDVMEVQDGPIYSDFRVWLEMVERTNASKAKFRVKGDRTESFLRGDCRGAPKNLVLVPRMFRLETGHLND